MHLTDASACLLAFSESEEFSPALSNPNMIEDKALLTFVGRFVATLSFDFPSGVPSPFILNCDYCVESRKHDVSNKVGVGIGTISTTTSVRVNNNFDSARSLSNKR